MVCSPVFGVHLIAAIRYLLDDVAHGLLTCRDDTPAEAGVDFAFETTLAARTFATFLDDCKTRGYTINLIYLWLPSADLAVERVAKRVASGGHNIPVEVVRRRL